MSTLCKTLIKTHGVVFSSHPDPDSVQGTHTLEPGDWVYLKNHVRKSLERDLKVHSKYS